MIAAKEDDMWFEFGNNIFECFKMKVFREYLDGMCARKQENLLNSFDGTQGSLFKTIVNPVSLLSAGV